MRFTTPLALLLLLTLPIFAYLGWPSRGYGRGREITSLVLRLIIVLCLILALAGLELLRGSNQLATVFLVDASDSMPVQAKTAATDYIRTALQEMGPDDQAAIILFGGDALVERPMSPSKELGTFTSIPNTGQTDLAEAIRLGLALYPSGAARRMVILSDGATTAGDAESATKLATNSGVDVIAVPFVFTPPAEVLLTDVQAPDRLLKGERFELRFTVTATEPTQAGIRVLAAGQVVYEGALDLDRGTHSYSIPLIAGDPGFTNYELQLTALDDTYYQNNELAAFSQVAGPPKILLVAPPEGEKLPFQDAIRPDEYTHLINALEFAGFIVEYVRPIGLPSELPLLAEYATVVMVDVPARQLNNRQMLALQTYVRDLGGGLVVVGGPTSYGVGGYFRTPLEETLPVDMQIKDEERRPTLTMVFIIDHSGSMGETSGGVTKLDLAKEAASRSVEFLFPGDRVGVVMFDDAASWVVPITELSDPIEVTNLIDGISLGGGTDIYAGLLAMSQVLPNDPADGSTSSAVKHVILLTDGGANPAGIPELVERMYTDYGITLTTVGVGRDAAPFLEDLARIGNGRYHFAEDPASLPTIFTEETTLATRSYLVEETFFPALVSDSPILNGITEVPPLHGYVGTSSKDTAQTILVSAKGDPILAAWQYGLGKAVAFTSDASPRWARDWVVWDGFPAFWAQAIRFTINQNVATGLSISVEQDGENAKLIVDAQTDSGLYLNNYTLTANIIDPTGAVQTVELSQVAPGRYEVPITPTEQGAYLLRVDGTSADGTQSVANLAGWVLSYSPEYRSLQADPDALLNLVTLTGGRLTTGDPAEAFAHTLIAPADTRPIWPWLLTLAAILLPFDIAVRRLAVDRRDLTRAWQRFVGRLTPVPAGAPVIPERSERMATLLDVKERAGDGTQSKQGTQVESASQRVNDSARQSVAQDQPPHHPTTPPPPETRRAEVFVAPKEESHAPKTDSKPTDEGDGTTTSVLLSRKRERKQRRE